MAQVAEPNARVYI